MDTKIVEDFADINARLTKLEQDKRPLKVQPELTDRDFSPSELHYYAAPDFDPA